MAHALACHHPFLPKHSQLVPVECSCCRYQGLCSMRRIEKQFPIDAYALTAYGKMLHADILKPNYWNSTQGLTYFAPMVRQVAKLGKSITLTFTRAFLCDMTHRDWRNRWHSAKRTPEFASFRQAQRRGPDSASDIASLEMSTMAFHQLQGDKAGRVEHTGYD